YKTKEKYDKWMPFLIVAKQNGYDNNNNAKFDWESGLVVKLGEPDMGELIAVLEGRKQSVGTKGSLYHANNNGNKVVNFSSNEKGGFFLSVSAQDSNKTSLGKISLVLSDGEAALLLVLLKKAVELMYGW